MVAPLFVGRQAELAALMAALGRTRDGEPATILVGGEAASAGRASSRRC